MKFSIESDGQKEIFFSFRTAEEKTKIPKQTILRVLKSGKETYFRRSDKKVFTIKVENDGPFIQIDGIDFSTDEEIENAFGWSREIFYNRLLKQGGKYFNDCQGVIHKITWKSNDLAAALDAVKKEEMYMSIDRRGRYRRIYQCG